MERKSHYNPEVLWLMQLQMALAQVESSSWHMFNITIYVFNLDTHHCIVSTICHVLHLSVGFIVGFFPEPNVIPSNMYPDGLIQISR